MTSLRKKHCLRSVRIWFRVLRVIVPRVHVCGSTINDSLFALTTSTVVLLLNITNVKFSLATLTFSLLEKFSTPLYVYAVRSIAILRTNRFIGF